MTALTIVVANIAPLNGSILRPLDAGGTVAPGDAVYIGSDGDVVESDANAAVSARCEGLIVATHDGEATAVDGDAVSLCTYGPVGGFSGLTPGAQGWVSETAGEIDDAAPTGAGTWTHVIGYAESAEVFFVQPGSGTPSSNS